MESKLMRELREVRRLYDIRSILHMGGERLIVCPFPDHPHHDYTPSFSVFTKSNGVQYFQCMGACGKKGDVIDLVGYLYIGGYNPHNPEDIRKAISHLDQKFEWHEPAREEPVPLLAQNAWMKYPMGDKGREYAYKRGLNDETIARFKLGQNNGYLAIPVFEEEVLKAIKFRAVGKTELRFYSEKGSQKALFNYDAVAWKNEPFLFLKGEIPVMLMEQYGIRACGLSTGESTLIERWKPALTWAKKIVVVGDNDRNPETFEKTSAKAKYRADLLGAELKFPPKEYKDIDEWVLAEPEAVEEIRRWLFLTAS